MEGAQYKWTLNGVSHLMKQVTKKNEGRKWIVWREWHDERGFPQIAVEWFDDREEALSKYPGAQIQVALDI